jgi:hemoglobin/transferrin/lactoferrin receptor protein
MGYSFNPHFKIQAALENIFDINYRYFASGFSAPGRNLLITLRTAL